MDAITYQYSRVRGMADWRPQRKTVERLAQIKSVLNEYLEYLPLTIRQIFYRLVGTGRLDKTERAYGNLIEYINRGRRAGLIPFDAIRDGGTVFRMPLAWAGPRELVDTFIVHARQFRLDRQRGQTVYKIVACEAAGMVPQLERVADPFGIPVFSSGGFESTTEKHDLARLLGEYDAAEVLHIGDYDKSGTSMFTAFFEDVVQFAADLELPVEISFSRLAVLPEHIKRYTLPWAPPNPKDNRAFNDDKTVQAEALAPDEIANLLRNGIEDRIDDDVLQEVLAEEQQIRTELGTRLRPIMRHYTPLPPAPRRARP
jgi:hypothetical protein